MHEFDDYINSITGGLRISKKKRDELYEEFLDHLQMMKQNNISSGMAEGDAIKEAIRGFGDRRDLRLKLGKNIFNYRTIPNVLCGIFLLMIYRIASHLPVPGLGTINDIGPAVPNSVFIAIIGFMVSSISIGYFMPIIFKGAGKVRNIFLIALLLSPIMGMILSVSKGYMQTGLILFSSIVGGLLGNALGFAILVMVNKAVYKYRPSTDE